MKTFRVLTILFFCILIIQMGCERFLSVLSPPEEGRNAEIEYLLFNDSGCTGSSKRSQSLSDETYLAGYRLFNDTLTVTIHYQANCCPAFIDSVSIDGNRIDIQIDDTLNGCRCLCEYENEFKFLYNESGRLYLRFGWMGQPFELDTVIFVQATEMIVRHGTSFGECLGYCWKELEVANTMVTFTQVGRDYDWDFPDIVDTGRIRVAEWIRLMAAIDPETLLNMEDRYGCPDCADGGAEWIEVITRRWRKKITFEYGDSIRGIQDLIDQLREIRQRFEEE